MQALWNFQMGLCRKSISFWKLAKHLPKQVRFITKHSQTHHVFMHITKYRQNLRTKTKMQQELATARATSTTWRHFRQNATTTKIKALKLLNVPRPQRYRYLNQRQRHNNDNNKSKKERRKKKRYLRWFVAMPTTMKGQRYKAYLEIDSSNNCTLTTGNWNPNVVRRLLLSLLLLQTTFYSNIKKKRS